MQPIVLGFDDFKSLTGNHRIYYYEGDNFYDFHFLSDGQIVKTTLLKDNIENKERFFSDKMFYGAMRLTFNIPVKDENVLFSTVTEGIKVDIQQEEEVKQIDIQREGVDAEDVE